MAVVVARVLKGLAAAAALLPRQSGRVHASLLLVVMQDRDDRTPCRLAQQLPPHIGEQAVELRRGPGTGLPSPEASSIDDRD